MRYGEKNAEHFIEISTKCRTLRKEQSFLLNIHRIDSIKCKPQKLIKANSKCSKMTGPLSAWQCNGMPTTYLRVNCKQNEKESTQDYFPLPSTNFISPDFDNDTRHIVVALCNCAVELCMYRQRVCISVYDVQVRYNATSALPYIHNLCFLLFVVRLD